MKFTCFSIFITIAYFIPSTHLPIHFLPEAVIPKNPRSSAIARALSRRLTSANRSVQFSVLIAMTVLELLKRLFESIVNNSEFNNSNIGSMESGPPEINASHQRFRRYKKINVNFMFGTPHAPRKKINSGYVPGFKCTTKQVNGHKVDSRIFTYKHTLFLFKVIKFFLGHKSLSDAYLAVTFGDSMTPLFRLR